MFDTKNFIFHKKKKTLLWYLHSALTGIEDSLESYRDYLNTSNKDYWDYFILFRHFDVCLIHIYEKNLATHLESKLEELFLAHDSFLKLERDYNPKERLVNSEKIIKYYHYFNVEITNLFYSEVKKVKIANKEDIATLTNYEAESDRLDFIERFEGRLSKLNLLSKSLKAA